MKKRFFPLPSLKNQVWIEDVQQKPPILGQLFKEKSKPTLKAARNQTFKNNFFHFWPWHYCFPPPLWSLLDKMNTARYIAGIILYLQGCQAFFALRFKKQTPTSRIRRLKRSAPMHHWSEPGSRGTFLERTREGRKWGSKKKKREKKSSSLRTSSNGDTVCISMQHCCFPDRSPPPTHPPPLNKWINDCSN